MERSTWNNSKGFVIKWEENKVSKLFKFLYDLKWHEKFNKVILLNKFNINKIYKYVCVKNIDKSCVIICL
jgi:hypothetical protein